MAMEEHRIARRQRVFEAGKIIVNGGTIDCTVRNLSASGAALEVASPLGIPDVVVILIGEVGAERRAKVIWRTESRIGVTFLDKFSA